MLARFPFGCPGFGDGEEIWSEAVQAFRNRRDYYKREGLWDDVCAQYQAYRARNDGGTMADSSKRQRSSDHVTAPGTPPPRAGNREFVDSLDDDDGSFYNWAQVVSTSGTTGASPGP